VQSALQLHVVGLLLGATLGAGGAEPNINPARAYAWSPNLGWLNWRPDPVSGVAIGQFICSGYVYSANVGWISLGSGSPANGMQYGNASATDYGLNVDMRGRLRGLAYGANIGWITFEDSGSPQLDLLDGRFSGYAYSANAGWISLDGAGFSLSADTISPGPDLDRDGLADDWELIYVGDLTTLTATGDADGDGLTNPQEYAAGTDPLDPDDHLRLLSVSLAPDKATVTLSWTSKPTRIYQIQSCSDWLWSAGWQNLPIGPQRSESHVTSRTVPVTAQAEFFRIEATSPLGAH
jgi:hypothetical protein